MVWMNPAKDQPNIAGYAHYAFQLMASRQACFISNWVAFRTMEKRAWLDKAVYHEIIYSCHSLLAFVL